MAEAYEFGPFRVDPLKRVLFCKGQPVALNGRAVDILIALIEHRDRVVAKGELLRLVWPDTTVQEANLSQNVFLLRKALGERPHDRRYILTVPGYGYRFVAEVREQMHTQATAIASAPPAPRHGIRSIAVLPFPTIDGDHASEHLGVGLADALITRLSGLRQLVVRPTSAVLRYVDPAMDSMMVGRTLNVDALVLGTLRRDGHRLRLSVQLVAVSNAAILWAARFDEELTDIFSVEDSISEQVAKALVLELTDAEHTALAKRHTDNTAAQHAYFKGRYFWNKRTEDGLRRAIEYFEQAITHDPGYALAYAGLGDCRNMLSIYSAVSPSEGCLLAAEAAAKAILIDDTLAEAHTALAYANFNYYWDLVGPEQGFLRALQLAPNYAVTHQLYADLLTAAGRFPEAMAAITRAHALDPVSLVINTDVGVILYHSRQHDRAIQQLRETLELDGSFWYAHWMIGLNYEQTGLYNEAIGSFLQARALVPESPYVIASLGRAYAGAGRLREAHRALDEMTRLAAVRYVSPYAIATLHVALDNRDQALAWLERAYDEHTHWLAFMNVEPMLDGVRNEPRFHALIERVQQRGAREALNSVAPGHVGNDAPAIEEIRSRATVF